MPSKKNYGYFNRLSTCLDKVAASDLELELEKDVRAGMKPKDLREKYMSRVTARSILNALTSEPKAANSAIRDLTDRQEGRPVEKKEIRHHLEALSDTELQALLLTEIDDLKGTQTLQ